MNSTRVLVGIPTLNGPDRLQRCLRAIEESTRFSAFASVKVLVCDDGSTPENLNFNKDVVHRAEGLRRAAGLEMLTNNARLGISTSWNRLTRHQDADVVVLMNDDIEVVEDWLDVLVYSLTRNPIIGTVSLASYTGLTKEQAYESHKMWRPKLDYRESKLLWGGGSLVSSGGAIFAFKRTAFDQVDGFDEKFFCFFEECDFGLRLIEQGYVPVFASYPSVFHLGSQTTTDERNMDHRKVMEASRTHFREKWAARSSHGANTITALREELLSRHRVPPVFHEWNSQIRDWNDG